MNEIVIWSKIISPTNPEFDLIEPTEYIYLIQVTDYMIENKLKVELNETIFFLDDQPYFGDHINKLICN